MKAIASLLFASLVFAAPVAAQTKAPARAPLVPSDTQDPIVGPIFGGIKSRGGEPLNMHRTVANAPKIFKAYVDMAITLRTAAVTPRADRELIILRTAQLGGGDYEYAQLGELTVTSAFYGAVSQITRSLAVQLEPNAGQTAYGAC